MIPVRRRNRHLALLAIAVTIARQREVYVQLG